MPSTSGERDLERAKSLRASAKGVRSAEAKRRIIEASDRLELRAASKLNKLGRRTRKKPGTGAAFVGPRLPNVTDLPDRQDIRVD